MQNLVYFAPALGCLAMAVMMFFMMRGRHGQSAAPSRTDTELAQLRAEIAALKAEQAIQAGQPVYQAGGNSGDKARHTGGSDT